MTLTLQLVSVCFWWVGGPSLFFSMEVYTYKNNATFQIYVYKHLRFKWTKHSSRGFCGYKSDVITIQLGDKDRPIIPQKVRGTRGQLVRHVLNPSQVTGGGRRGETHRVPWKRMHSLSKQRWIKKDGKRWESFKMPYHSPLINLNLSELLRCCKYQYLTTCIYFHSSSTRWDSHY